jgi:predicted nucleic acid-binding protein
MVDSPSRYAIDTNILIDLHMGEVLQEFFNLPLVILAPDVIVAEAREPSGATLRAYGLNEVSFSGEQVLEVYALRGRYRRVGLNDLFALMLARVEGVPLLTGDRHLRQAAEQEGVVVRGTLWILDTMIEHRVLTAARGTQALQTMLDNGRRLPVGECDVRMHRWSNA